ncbi:hypothetical protein [Aminobacter ciceronei]|uniref:Uncharacterized protein n=1 Tax=Aminobacter ciceronei TaxID=150723 RepID=A0ABR6C6B5_9HYPH|nr:hypothetical protein [Aminobacter ciceronei]MBA8906776.1 hypothetical protein [Aminobacter ciceronei]MBA9020555.1 hypothetical protein [Aminobacter ciceronei]
MKAAVTSEDIDRSLHLLGLLAVCAHASSTINEVSGMTTQQVASGLASCMVLAIGLAGQQHDLLDAVRDDQG